MSSFSRRRKNEEDWLVEVLLYVHRNRRFIRTSTSTFTQLLSSVNRKMDDGWMKWCLVSSDVS